MAEQEKFIKSSERKTSPEDQEGLEKIKKARESKHPLDKIVIAQEVFPNKDKEIRTRIMEDEGSKFSVGETRKLYVDELIKSVFGLSD